MITGHLGLGSDPPKWVGPGKGSHMTSVYTQFMDDARKKANKLLLEEQKKIFLAQLK